jgi:hypothetical protein
MKNLLTNLSNTIHEDFAIALPSQEIEISENNSNCKKVILKTSKENVFAFSLDRKLKQPCKVFSFFNSSTKGINKVNDGIVFYCKNDEIFVLLVELKSNKLGDYKKQLQAGKNFTNYLLSVVNSSFSKKYILKDEHIKCLVFSLRKTSRKQSTKKNKMSFEEINGLHIAELECNSSYFISQFV